MVLVAHQSWIRINCAQGIHINYPGRSHIEFLFYKIDILIEEGVTMAIACLVAKGRLVR